MASAQVVEMSVANNSPSQDSNHPHDLFQPRYVNPGFKPFSQELISCFSSNTYREIKCTTSSTFCIRIIINCSTRQCRTLKQEIILTRALDQGSIALQSSLPFTQGITTWLQCVCIVICCYYGFSPSLLIMTYDYFPCRSIHSVSF